MKSNTLPKELANQYPQQQRLRAHMQVYSSTPIQRLSQRLKALNRKLLITSMALLSVAAFLYGGVVTFEHELQTQYQDINQSIILKQDLDNLMTKVDLMK